MLIGNAPISIPVLLSVGVPLFQLFPSFAPFTLFKIYVEPGIWASHSLVKFTQKVNCHRQHEHLRDMVRKRNFWAQLQFYWSLISWVGPQICALECPQGVAHVQGCLRNTVLEGPAWSSFCNAPCDGVPPSLKMVYIKAPKLSALSVSRSFCGRLSRSIKWQLFLGVVDGICTCDGVHTRVPGPCQQHGTGAGLGWYTTGWGLIFSVQSVLNLNLVSGSFCSCVYETSSREHILLNCFMPFRYSDVCMVGGPLFVPSAQASKW